KRQNEQTTPHQMSLRARAASATYTGRSADSLGARLRSELSRFWSQARLETTHDVCVKREFEKRSRFECSLRRRRRDTLCRERPARSLLPPSLQLDRPTRVSVYQLFEVERQLDGIRWVEAIGLSSKHTKGELVATWAKVPKGAVMDSSGLESN